MYEYKVVEIREKMIGGKMSGPKLEQMLNENARQGWQLKAITSADVKGRMGPGGVEGLLGAVWYLSAVDKGGEPDRAWIGNSAAELPSRWCWPGW
jgi:hypothetical protein